MQYAFVRVLAGDSGQVFVVGDDDQAIYGWRGAKVENVQRFLRDYPGAQTFKLEQNYRSTGNILAAANAVIAHNPERLGKQLWTDSGDGEPIDLYTAYNEVDEARFVVERVRAWIAEEGAPATARCCTAATRSRAPSKNSSGRRACPTACTAACASSSAWRSRTRWPTCAWSRTATTTPPSSARSTRRRAASASAPSTRCGGWRARRACRCGRRRRGCRKAPRRPATAPRWPGARATRCAASRR